MRLFLFLFLIPLSALAGTEGMPGMPTIAPKKSQVVSSVAAGEALQEQRGFGDKEPEVRMMNLMMVGGSGMEGMAMDSNGSMNELHSSGAHEMAVTGPEKAEKPKAISEAKRYSAKPKSVALKKGAQPFEFMVLDTKSGKPAPGLRIRVELSMRSMDMGTDTPKVQETTPGHYRVKLVFAMKGPWSLKIIFPNGDEESLPLEVGTP